MKSDHFHSVPNLGHLDDSVFVLGLAVYQTHDPCFIHPGPNRIFGHSCVPEMNRPHCRLAYRTETEWSCTYGTKLQSYLTLFSCIYLFQYTCVFKYIKETEKRHPPGSQNMSQKVRDWKVLNPFLQFYFLSLTGLWSFVNSKQVLLMINLDWTIVKIRWGYDNSTSQTTTRLCHQSDRVLVGLPDP